MSDFFLVLPTIVLALILAPIILDVIGPQARAVRHPLDAARDRRRDRPHELGDDRPRHPEPGAVAQGADVRRPGPGHRLGAGPDHAPPHPAQRREPDRRPVGAHVRRRRCSPRRRSRSSASATRRRRRGASSSTTPSRRARRASGRGGTSPRRPPRRPRRARVHARRATRSTTSSTPSRRAGDDRAGRDADRRCADPAAPPRSGDAASGRCPSWPTRPRRCSRSRTSRSGSGSASGSVKAVDGVSLPARRRRGARDRRRVGLRQDDDGAVARPAAAGERADPVGGKVELFGIDLVPKTEQQLARYRWREISIVFQGAMNALNPVRRVGDQIAEPIEVRLGQPREQSREAGGGAARPRRDPAASGRRRTRTSCRAACASGR